jgi:hypothetical protein
MIIPTTMIMTKAQCSKGDSPTVSTKMQILKRYITKCVGKMNMQYLISIENRKMEHLQADIILTRKHEKPDEVLYQTTAATTKCHEK